jgi:hypothetical protein
LGFCVSGDIFLFYNFCNFKDNIAFWFSQKNKYFSIIKARKKCKPKIDHPRVAVYSVVKNGFSFVTIAIIALVFFIIYKKPNDKAVQEEIESRKSNQDDEPQG